MSNHDEETKAIRAYVKRLENPYAWLQVIDDPDLTVSAGHEVKTDAAAASVPPKCLGDPIVRRLQNPYATLYYNESADSYPEVATAEAMPRRTRTLSKQAFRNGCRRIFQQYIPPLEGSRLRAHHRDFINRNESESPEARSLILTELKKYDLSDIHGLSTHFNRERDQLTEAKLRDIEQRIRQHKSR